jgi:hypothetical protein
MNVLFADPEINDRSKQARLENVFYNIVEGEKVSAGKTLSVILIALERNWASFPMWIVSC